MQGWRGLLVLAAGLIIGIGLWAGLAEVGNAPAPPPRFAEAESPPAGPPPPPPQAAPSQGVSGAVGTKAGDIAPPHPVKIMKRADDLQILLQSAPYVHRGLKGPALYVVTFRDCPACVRFEKEAWGPLESAGVDVRWIVYARRALDGEPRSSAKERAVVAELALNRNFKLLNDWLTSKEAAFYAGTKLPPDAKSSPKRKQALETTRSLVDALAHVTQANGEDMGIPTFFWHASGGWYALIGYDKAAFAKVRASLLAEAADTGG